nr:D340 [uncultured bacterium]
MANGNREPGTEPGAVPNCSEPASTVPDSERWARAAASAKRGHGRSLTDEDLIRLAEGLTDRLGRLPTGTELIDAAGGCQKQRALRALQSVRLKLAERDAAATLAIPPAIEAELRTLMARWISVAGQQLSSRIARAQIEAEARLQEAADVASDMGQAMLDLKAQIADLQRIRRELTAKTKHLQSELRDAQRDRDTAQALTAERERVMSAVIASREAAHDN